MKKNTGKDYEVFVGDIYKSILLSNEMGFSGQQNIIVEVDKKLKDKNGIERQFDIYWEYASAGLIYKTVIECKDYNSSISIDRIDALIGKLQDFPNLRGLFATKKGYQSGAEEKAKKHGIELLIVREQNDSDWKSKNGEPYLKETHINMTLIPAARITFFTVLIPKELQDEPPIKLTALNTEISIKNLDTHEEFTLHDLQSKLVNAHEDEFGEFDKLEVFKGLVIYPGGDRRIDGYHVKYQIAKPHTETLIYDFTQSLIGVVEYLSQNKKARIFDNGKIHYE